MGEQVTQLEIAARAAAGAMGLNPATEWEAARPVAEAVLAAVAERAREEVVPPNARDDELIADLSAMVGVIRGKETSPEVAAIAARLMLHEDPDVRCVAASALAQREA